MTNLKTSTELKAIAKEKINDNQWIGRAKIEDMTRTEGEG